MASLLRNIIFIIYIHFKSIINHRIQITVLSQG